MGELGKDAEGVVEREEGSKGGEASYAVNLVRRWSDYNCTGTGGS